MKIRALVCLLLISIGFQPITLALASVMETPTEKATEETLERPLDTMTQELLESEPTSEEETLTETTDSVDELEAPIDIESPASTPETLSAPREVITMPWGQTICTIEGKFDLGYTITVRAGSGTVAGTRDQAPWTSPYRIFVKKIIFDGSDGKIQLVGNQTNLFSYCGILESIDLSGVDTSQVTDMSWMFASCYDLSSLDVSGFNTSQVTRMDSMFSGCSQLSSLDLSNFDTRLVTNMGGMFQATSKLRTLKLGSQTLLKTDCSLRLSNANGYTGKWTTLGTGTLERPKGDWSGTVAELCARSQTGVADTYVWEPQFYTITFDTNGGSNVPDSIKAYKDDVVDLSTGTSPAPPTSAYGFAGWTTVIDDLTTKVETLTMPANDVTLYASWKVLMGINSIPDDFIFKHNVMRNEYTHQFVTLNSQDYPTKAAFKTNWQSTQDWKLTVKMAEWRNPDDSTDTLTDVQMYMDNQLTYQDGSTAPSTIHSNQQVVLNAGETQTLVTTTAGNSADGTGNWKSTIDFDSVKLKIPRYGGREGSYYTSQLIWSLDDTL